MADDQNEEKLKRLRAMRSGNRGVVTKYIKEAIELIKVGEDSGRGRLCTIASLLSDKTDLLKQLDKEILELCDVKDIAREIEESDEVSSRASDVQREITEFTSRQSDKPTKLHVTHSVSDATQENTTTSATNEQLYEETNGNDVSMGGISTNSSTGKHTNSKLPKLVLPKFKGDVTNYRAFWETFQSAVHDNEELSTIAKFNYLFSLLEGQALRAIKGLAITESNYTAAIDILHERFGKTQQIIAAHMDELLKISTCDGDKSKQLRFVYDKVSVNIRALEALGIQSDQYGSLLIPVIMSKLPSDVRLQIART